MHESAGHMYDSAGHMHSVPHVQTRIRGLITTFFIIFHLPLSYLCTSLSFSDESTECCAFCAAAAKTRRVREVVCARASYSAIASADSKPGVRKLERVVGWQHVQQQHGHLRPNGVPMKNSMLSFTSAGVESTNVGKKSTSQAHLKLACESPRARLPESPAAKRVGKIGI